MKNLNHSSPCLVPEECVLLPCLVRLLLLVETVLPSITYWQAVLQVICKGGIFEEIFYAFPSNLYLQIFCEACRYLHTAKGPQIVEDLENDWVEGQCRMPPVITYSDIDGSIENIN